MPSIPRTAATARAWARVSLTSLQQPCRLTACSPAIASRRCLSAKADQQNRPHHRTVADFLDWRPDVEAHDVVVHGYVRSVRSMKSEVFVHVGDGSTRKPLQALVPRHMEGGSGLRVGAAIRLRGSWLPSKYADQSHELKVDQVDILGSSDAATYPIQKKYQTPDFLRTIPHLRSRLPLNAAILRLRSDAISTLTQFFASRSFVQTHTPIITSSDCEGAGEAFTVSAGQSETLPDTSAAGKESDCRIKGSKKTGDMFFRSPKYLTVSGQLHLEALAQSLGNVWTLSPTFRAEKSDTSRHMSEFYMLEAEMPFTEDMADVMDLAEDMLRNLTSTLYQSRSASELRERRSQSSSRTAEDDLVSQEEVERRWAGMMHRPDARWPRVTYNEALKLLEKEAHRFDNPPTWEGGLHSEHEKFLAKAVGATGEKGIYRPVFVTHYPRDIKAFYMRTTAPRTGSRSDGTDVGRSDGTRHSGVTVDCFDLLVPDLCEIAGGSMREHRLAELEQAMEQRGMVAPSASNRGRPASTSNGLDWYLDLRRWGTCPHGGFGIGFDRLLSYLAGVQNVRDVVAFPRWFGRCDA